MRASRLKQLVADDKTCHLLKLPPELRNHIWTLACTPLGEKADRFGVSPGTIFRREQSAITRICRQVRNESLPLFYANGPFIVCSRGRGTSEAVNTWLSSIGDNVRHLESLIVSDRLRVLTRDNPGEWTYYTFNVRVTLAVHEGQVKVHVTATLDDTTSVPNNSLIPAIHSDATTPTHTDPLAQTCGNSMARDLEAALVGQMLHRSKRLAARAPGFAAHEWASMIGRTIDIISKDAPRYRYRGWEAWRVPRGRR